MQVLDVGSVFPYKYLETKYPKYLLVIAWIMLAHLRVQEMSLWLKWLLLQSKQIISYTGITIQNFVFYMVV